MKIAIMSVFLACLGISASAQMQYKKLYLTYNKVQYEKLRTDVTVVWDRNDPCAEFSVFEFIDSSGKLVSDLFVLSKKVADTAYYKTICDQFKDHKVLEPKDVKEFVGCGRIHVYMLYQRTGSYFDGIYDAVEEGWYFGGNQNQKK